MSDSQTPAWAQRRILELERALAAGDRTDSLAASRWQLLMDRSPFGIVIYLPDGTIAAGNEAMRHQFGLTEEESELAISIYNILEDPQVAERGLDGHVQKAFDGEPSVFPATLYDLETPIEHRRVRRWLEGLFFPVLDNDGNLREVVSIQTDVTRLVEAREELKRSKDTLADQFSELEQLYASTPVGLCLVDRNLRYLRINETMAAINGPSAEEHLGRTLLEILPDIGPRLERDYRAVIETGEPRLNLEVHGTTPVDPGTERDWLVSYYPLTSDDGTVRAVSTVVQEITERKKAEEDRRMLEARVQHAQKLESLGVLAGGIAHDFNNLLLVILGNAELAHSLVPRGSSESELLAQVKTAAQRASELTHQMLAYSGKGRFNIRPIDLNRLVEEMGQLLHSVISKKTTLTFDLAPGLPMIDADGGQIRQVVMNLLTNASEALGEGSGVVRVSTRLVQADEALEATDSYGEALGPGAYVRLEVSDTGSGMDRETLDRLFEPFYTTRFTGRGLGLAAVLGIVKRHGGAVRVQSKLSQGSVLSVLLPPSTQGSEKVPMPDSGVRTHQKKSTVLVVDDEAAVREVARRMLETAGHEVLTAADGVEAVEIFREYADSITLVLLDLTMPRLDGEETLRRLREIRGDACVLLTSGYTEEDAMRRFANLGLAGFLQKPYTPDRLEEKLHEALTGRASGR